MALLRNLLLLLPFVLVVWVHWVRSIRQQQRDKPRTSLVQRDGDRVRAAILRRQGRHGAQQPSGASHGVEPTRRTARGAEQPSATARVDQQPLATAARKPAAAAQQPPATGCPASRKPFHTLLTATAQVYQQWQCRVMYYQWKKQRANDPAGACTEMTGFTRLVAHGDARPDGLENEIPSFFVKEYTQRDYARFRGYRVINRPYSVTQLLKSDYWKSQVREARRGVAYYTCAHPTERTHSRASAGLGSAGARGVSLHCGDRPHPHAAVAQ